MTLDERTLGQAIASIVQAALAPMTADVRALQAALGGWELRWNDLGMLRERMAVLEVRAAVPGPPGPVGARGEKGEKGEAGIGLIGERGEKGETGAIGPRGEKGADGLSIKGDQGERGERGEKGADGLSVKGEPGQRGERGEPGIGVKGDRGELGPAGIDGKDGADLVQALIDREGNLILTLSNGYTKTVGLVIGRDGRDGTDGRPGRDLDLEQVRDAITKEVAIWPKPKDGKDGAPGLSPDDFDWDFNDDTRELRIRLIREGRVVVERKKILTGVRIYRGVYEAGRTYERGDDVSWDGSIWTAMIQTDDRPGQGPTAWKMTVKHGEKGPRGQDGKPGRDGRDLTNMGPRGEKWGA